MTTRQIHFKNYDLAQPLISGIETKYNVFSKLNRYGQHELLLTFEIAEENLDNFLELIESFGLETY